MNIDDAKLDEWEALCNNATPGPWKIRQYINCMDLCESWLHPIELRLHDGLRNADVHLLQFGRNDLPTLIAEIRTLKAQLSEAQAKLAAQPIVGDTYYGRRVVSVSESPFDGLRVSYWEDVQFCEVSIDEWNAWLRCRQTQACAELERLKESQEGAQQ